MRTPTVVALFLLVAASTAAAQSKLETKWHCATPGDQQYEVGDVADHSYGIAQGNCNAVSSQTGEKTGVFTESQEMWKDSFTTHGSFVLSMEDGDKMYYTYEATGNPAKKTIAEKWKLVGGTGKHKDIKGSGSCSGTLNDDGTSDWICSGTTGS